MTTRSASLPPPGAITRKHADALRTVLIGVAGGIGYVHLRELEANPHLICHGAFDLYPQDPAVANGLAHVLKLGGQIYRSFAEVLADPAVEAVDLCVPHHFHRPYAVAAFQAGKHVLVEKPMASSPEDCQVMQTARLASGRVGAVQMQHLGRSSMLDLRAQLAAGAIGQIKEVFISSLWFRTEAYYQRAGWAGKMKVDGAWCVDGALFNQCIHYLVQGLILANPAGAVQVPGFRDLQAALYKFHEAPLLEAGDTCFATATLETPDQPRLTLVGTTASATERHRIDILGTQGRAMWNGSGFLYPNGQPTQEFTDDNQFFDGTSRIFTSFAQAVRGHGTALTDFSAIAPASTFIFNCYDSAHWQIKPVAWRHAQDLPGQIIPAVCTQRCLPGGLKTPPAWA